MHTILTSRTLYGEIEGTAWGGFQATLDVTLSLPKGALSKTLARALIDKGGDFQDDRKFSPDSVIVLKRERRSAGRVVTRERIFTLPTQE